MAQPLFGEDMSKRSIASRRKLAETLMSQALDSSPKAHWMQAIAQAVQGGLGGYEMAGADRAENDRMSAIAQALQGGMSPDELMQAGVMYEEPGLGDMGEFKARQAQAEAAQQAQAQRQAQEDAFEREKFAYQQQHDAKKLAAEQAAAGVPKASDVLGVVKEYGGQPGVKRYNEVYPTVQSMHKSLSDPSAVADLDFVYGVAKVLDPESVVREGEQLVVRQTQNMPSQIAGVLNKLISGQQVLDTTTRANLYALARRRASELYGQGQSERQFYLNFGKPYGIGEEQLRPLGDLPPEVAVPPHAAPAPAPTMNKTRSGVNWSIQ
jgi:hypothetical protein